MSLKSIFLRDFVIVHALELDLSKGFTVLTGETGAGKSILIDALQLALGARADAAMVREGAQRCEISATFDCPASLVNWLDENGLPAGEELLLKRTIDVQAKSRAWVILFSFCFFSLRRRLLTTDIQPTLGGRRPALLI